MHKMVSCCDGNPKNQFQELKPLAKHLPSWSRMKPEDGFILWLLWICEWSSACFGSSLEKPVYLCTVPLGLQPFIETTLWWRFMFPNLFLVQLYWQVYCIWQLGDTWVFYMIKRWIHLTLGITWHYPSVQIHM